MSVLDFGVAKHIHPMTVRTPSMTNTFVERDQPTENYFFNKRVKNVAVEEFCLPLVISIDCMHVWRCITYNQLPHDRGHDNPKLKVHS